MNTTTLLQIKQLSQKYGFYIELKFGESSRAIVHDADSDIYVSRSITEGEIIEKIESACVQLQERIKAQNESFN